ncbi:MAG: helix-turn-helix transcriptional regulator [Bacteroidetes bacterium]|nr:helix-turn-helix transcriptional regulator [Bacteroidota bacterium]MBU1371318.1 helix-turn-helix transcriptional regulator [Bacteroidota bacterium]MBU1485805.1 helix-turn-helix transcriptional regulator [Bacteroidota bacterium]MBU1761575.1 helix-turn-helix transcriptional regulator [Bacteroidota bacterium]MBU2046265.1 helix-turn-helix transcriptional regulator [Bacteroidota bacterium]
MSKLKQLREKQNLTQEELSEKSTVSVRTIQRIEAGKDPKGYTLRVLAETLGVLEKELTHQPLEVEEKEDNEEPIPINYSKIKLINLSSLPFVVVPLLNILVPLLLMFTMKLKNPITKQIISLQIMWTIIAPIIFMLGIFLKLGRSFTLILIICLLLSNIYLILRNAVAIDQKKKLHYKLNFSMI